MKAEHELKCWPEFFARILTGEKTFEARKDDRGFRGGDTLRIREWKRDGEVYTGREVTVEVTYLLAGPMFGVQPGWAVMGFTPPAALARAHAEGLEAGWSAARKLALQEITQLADNAKHDMWAHPAFVQAHEYVFRALNAEGARSLIPAAPEVKDG